MRKREFEDAVAMGADIERERLRQLQREGIDAARERGVVFGRPRIERPDGFEDVLAAFRAGEMTRREAAEELGVSVSTFDRWRKGVR